MAVQFIFPPPLRAHQEPNPRNSVTQNSIAAATGYHYFRHGGYQEAARGSWDDAGLPDPGQAGTRAPRDRGEPLYPPAGHGDRGQDPDPPSPAQARDEGVRLLHLLSARGRGRRRLLRLPP